MRVIELTEAGPLKRGDIVRHKTSGNSYVVERLMARGQAVIVRTEILSNPPEWFLIEFEESDNERD